jgi:hypothetical protein
MTPTELTQVLTAIENMKSDLARVKTAALTTERKLAGMPNQTETCKILTKVEEHAHFALLNLDDVSITLNITELNEILNIQTKCRNVVVNGVKHE